MSRTRESEQTPLEGARQLAKLLEDDVLPRLRRRTEDEDASSGEPLPGRPDRPENSSEDESRPIPAAVRQALEDLYPRLSAESALALGELFDSWHRERRGFAEHERRRCGPRVLGRAPGRWRVSPTRRGRHPRRRCRRARRRCRHPTERSYRRGWKAAPGDLGHYPKRGESPFPAATARRRRRAPRTVTTAVSSTVAVRPQRSTSSPRDRRGCATWRSGCTTTSPTTRSN